MKGHLPVSLGQKEFIAKNTVGDGVEMPRALANTCAECGLPSRQHAHAAGHCYMFGHSDSGRVSDVITALELKGVTQPVTVGFSGKLLLAFYQNYLSFFNFMKNEALPNVLLVKFH